MAALETKRPCTLSDRPASDGLARVESGPAPSRVSAGALAFVSALLLAGYAVRVFMLGHQSLWWDEAGSLEIAQLDFVELTRYTAADIHPPAWYYLLKLWVGLSGNSEFAARYLSLPFGLLLLPVGYVLALRLFGRSVALVAAALAALSPFYVHYSQEVRMYTLLVLITELAVYAFLRAASVGGPRSWMAYAALMVLALYTHLYAALVFAFVNLAYVSFLATGRHFRAPKRWPGGMRAYLLAQAAVVLLYVPWIQVAVEKFQSYTSPSRGSTLSWIVEQTTIVFTLGHAVVSITSFPGQPGFDDDRALALKLSLPFVSLALLGLAAMVVGRRQIYGPLWSDFPSPTLRSRAFFAAAYLVVPLILIILLSIGRRDFNARYLIAASPAYYLLVAAGFVALARLRFGRYLAVVAGLGLVAVWAFALSNYYFVEKYSRDDYRSAVAYLRRHALPGDLVVLDANFEAAYRYYAGDEFTWIRFPESVPPDHQQSLATLARVAPKHDRVWLLMIGDYFLDPDRVIQKWLDANAFRMDGISFHGPMIVYGYLMSPPVLTAAPSPTSPLSVRFGDELELLGYDLRADAGTARGRANITLYWRALNRMTSRYSVFVHALNQTGQMQGLGDSEPVNGYLPTTAWLPEQWVRSDLAVTFYPAAPPGGYRLVVGVYDQRTGQRLPTSRGDVVDIGSVRLTARAVDATGLDYAEASDVQFGDSIRLVGYRTARPAKDVLRVILFWQAQQKPPRQFTVFNHLVDSSGAIRAQKDGEPANGLYPTDRWMPGEVVRDEHDIYLPSGLSGSFELRVGLYAPESGERVPIRDWWPFGRRTSAAEIGLVKLTP